MAAVAAIAVMGTLTHETPILAQIALDRHRLLKLAKAAVENPRWRT